MYRPLLRNRLKALIVLVLMSSPAQRVAADAAPPPGSEPVVRISQGFFAADLRAEVQAKLEAGRASLDPALRTLPGLLHYYVAIDPVSNSVVNVSVWASLEAAQQMNGLEAMRVQRDAFVALGVRFEPIRNYTGLWSIGP
jgi:hypothetical protein